MAATWTVDSNPSRPANFRSLQQANDSTDVAQGDVLHVMPSTISYGAVTLNRRVTIIGPGYLLNQNLPFNVAAPSARTGDITLLGGASGSLITGMEVAGNITFALYDGAWANNVTIKRNRIEGSIVTSTGAEASNLQILQNLISGEVNFNPTNNSGLLIRGNHIGGSLGCIPDGTSGIVAHNVVNSTMSIGGSVACSNNLCRSTVYGYSHSLLTRNWGGSMTPWTGSPAFVDNQVWTADIKFDDQFAGTGSLDARWQLATAAAVKGSGTGGVDPGMFAGPDPYVLSGLPSVPLVTGVQAPSSASAASGLPVTVTIQVSP